MTLSHIARAAATRKEEGAGAVSIAWRPAACERQARERAFAEVRESIDRSGSGLIVESDGRVLGADLAPTGFRIEPAAGGLMVYVTDVCGARHWYGSPTGVASALRWLLLRARCHAARDGSQDHNGRNLATRVANR